MNDWVNSLRSNICLIILDETFKQFLQHDESEVSLSSSSLINLCMLTIEPANDWIFKLLLLSADCGFSVEFFKLFNSL